MREQSFVDHWTCSAMSYTTKGKYFFIFIQWNFFKLQNFRIFWKFFWQNQNFYNFPIFFDKFFEKNNFFLIFQTLKSNDANRRYINSVLEWNFGLKGVLRVGRIYFHKVIPLFPKIYYRLLRSTKLSNMENTRYMTKWNTTLT